MTTHDDYVVHVTNPLLAVPQPIKRKKRVTKTIYWEECPVCGHPLGNDPDAGTWQACWRQDTSLAVPERTYLPCGCVVRATP